jgi:AcrR family transcriptional regulator
VVLASHSAPNVEQEASVTRIAAADRRAALVQAALQVVAERGVAAATTRAIVAQAGMSLASFHYAFTSRDELMAQLISTALEQEELTLAAAFAPDFEPETMRDAIRAGLEQYFVGVKADPQREKAMFELTHYAMRTPGMAQLARQQYRRYYALAGTALEVASRKSGQRWNRPVSEIATLLVVLTDGLTIGWLVNRDDAAAATIMDFAADAVARLVDETKNTVSPERTRSP